MSEKLANLPPIESTPPLITGVPEFPKPIYTPTETEQFAFQDKEEFGKIERKLNFLERIKLGEDELAICGVIDLNPSSSADKDATIDTETERLIVLDVGFRQSKDGKYGPYDIDGSGVKKYFDKPYVVINSKTISNEANSNGDESPKYVEVGDNEEVTIGRSTPEGIDLGLDENDRISRSHTTIRFGGNLGEIEVLDNNSLNGVSVHAPGELVEASGSSFDYTVNVADFVHQSGKGRYYKDSSESAGRGYGEYAGRPIIARDTEINQGVYPVGGSHGEALVIDDVKYPKELTEVYEKVKEKIQNPATDRMVLRGLKRIIKGDTIKEGIDANSATLQAVFDIVSDTLRYDLEATNALARDSQKVSLNYYISEGVGVCRTQAALAAYQVERLINNGELRGRVSIDRSSRVDPDGDGSGHAWARFTDEEGRVYIIDPAQKYVGPINDSPDKNWDYRRTEDIIKQIAASK